MWKDAADLVTRDGNFNNGGRSSITSAAMNLILLLLLQFTNRLQSPSPP